LFVKSSDNYQLKNLSINTTNEFIFFLLLPPLSSFYGLFFLFFHNLLNSISVDPSWPPPSPLPPPLSPPPLSPVPPPPSPYPPFSPNLSCFFLIFSFSSPTSSSHHCVSVAIVPPSRHRCRLATITRLPSFSYSSPFFLFFFIFFFFLFSSNLMHNFLR